MPVWMSPDRRNAVALIKGSVQFVCHDAELDNELVEQPFRFDSAAFFSPDAGETCLVLAHDTHVRAADEAASGRQGRISKLGLAPRYRLR